MSDSQTSGRIPRVQITLHARWATVHGSTLDADAWARLPAYVTRYAQTLGVAVYAVGGAGDHFHLLFDLPMDQSPDGVTRELQGAVVRFMRSEFGQRGFAWAAGGVMQSVGEADRDRVCAYVSDNAAHHAAGTVVAAYEGDDAAAEGGTDIGDEAEALPAWLRDVLPVQDRATPAPVKVVKKTDSRAI